ncbi:MULTISPECIES: bifunctional 3-(3-hydroxy-phenyl)propionate/3-hydroxycinnamic acid hydroxylase [Rhodococcus]|uniref:bifunctional 3-(3-hydroxy-phenyl)propionate/3-hydroxycinnamic acid hydroxylase MhpA n=1 Tax=Rhodococcus TaxID=1827 RepID=UPI000C9BADA6|nr:MULTISPECIES: bifunctional 3-(3-hydroxy-phenyl)propionate/3-hydroxycinnamic acid hydroxylase [Rhodococcus]PND51561.1 3-(3-hydroxyphenyl)propionate hydroxylase [Rhodococcus sp. ENV425]USC15344.1 bifunctional 3-(3-hydroxy-phenyl)propionate/3-hydroxycinnamic acid hydroxylase [Rhodococcus sp. 11-3]WFS11774.1 bifunctional 3-(3-hydroxy-phenyl)propionate/3-hydroxycinnamic acid hydroxylase [Rhodococcus aetherivorans]WKW98711.1 bifunctional 3-(3-hydroxy-phenyl)propionate/3-hydroxycinnamic acid hydrox
MSERVVPVVIVGAGPTGLTAATLLAQHGVECLVLERWEGVYAQPRAVHLDGEIHRIVAHLGIADEFAAISRPCLGLRLLDRNMRILTEFHRDPGPGVHGYPEANMFDQPQFEEILRANLERYPGASLRGDIEVTGLAHDKTGGIRVDFTDRSTGVHESVRTRYVLGCDGANSMVREQIQATMRDLKFEQRWLVVDVATTADLGEWEGVHQVCDPVRAATYMRIGKTRYRWEFRLKPGESAEDYREMARLHPLISPWTRNTPAEDLELVRLAEYTFRARVADRWRDRHVFLLGDAAHLTPPFIGQGMGAGMRDAMNLAWKLAGVLRGDLPESALDTYEIERKPHARALIRRAKFVGMAMTEGGELGNLIRRVALPLLHRVPGLSDKIMDNETPALRRSSLIERSRLRRSRAGRLIPNPVLDEGRRFAEVVAGRFAVVTSVSPTTEQRTAIEQRGGTVLLARPDTDLHRWLRRGRARAVIVRPDGTVLRSGNELSALCAALPRFHTDHSPTILTR